MFSVVLSIHILLCLALIALVLKQQGKGADMGATFGGGSNTLFGAGGANDLIVKLTTSLAVCFFISSVVLIHLYRDATTVVRRGSPLSGSSVMKDQAPAAPVAADSATTESSTSEAVTTNSESATNAPQAKNDAVASSSASSVSSAESSNSPQESSVKKD